MLFKQRVWHGCSLFWVFSTSKIIKQVELAGNFLPEQTWNACQQEKLEHCKPYNSQDLIVNSPLLVNYLWELFVISR